MAASNKNNPVVRDHNTAKEYFAIGEVLRYFFRKKDPNHKPNFSLRMMHGVNKISIIMFLIGIIFFIVKLYTR
jgi:hypothetical protein